MSVNIMTDFSGFIQQHFVNNISVYTRRIPNDKTVITVEAWLRES